MTDTIIPIIKNAKLRVQQVVINNGDNKSVDWYLELRPITDSGALGSAIARDSVSEPIGPLLLNKEAPEGTQVSGIDIGGITGLQVQAWLQWHGESICAAKKDDVAATVLGVL